MMASQIEETAKVHVSVTARTDIGLRRPKNEDAFLVTDLSNRATVVAERGVTRIAVGAKGVLLVVSDGVGGQKAGEVASALVVEGLARALEQDPSSSPPAAQLKHAAARAHLDVAQAARERGREGMGATLTAAYIVGTSAFLAEVGDSRAYLIRGGVIRQLTRDQSVAQMLMDSGALNPDEAKLSPMKNILVQAMGMTSVVQVALGKLELRDRDCLLLCSDGLTGAVSDEEIRRAILESPSLDAAADRLITMANRGGGLDNVTVVLAGVGGDLAPQSRGERVSETYEILETFAPRHPLRRPDAPLVPAAVKVTR